MKDKSLEEILPKTKLAEIAYNAYVEAAGGVFPWTGEKFPGWESLGEKVQALWIASALAVLDAKEAVNSAFPGRY